MAESRAINKKKEIVMPPSDYVPHPELAASIDYQIAQQSKPVEEVVAPVRDETSQRDISQPEVQLETQQVEEVPHDEPSEALVEQPVKKYSAVNEENVRTLRQEKERLEREKQEMRLQMLEMQQRQYQQQNMPKQQEVVEEQFKFDLDEDSLVEGKQLKKMAQEMFEMKKMLKAQRNEIEQTRKETQTTTMDMKLKNQYPDFAQVFTKNNIDTFIASRPDLVDTVNAIPDEYQRTVAAYNYMKMMGISAPESNQSYEGNKQKISANIAKPRTATSAAPTEGGSPLSRMNGFAERRLTKEAAQQAWKETQEAMRRN